MTRNLLLVGIDGLRIDVAREPWVAPTLVDLATGPAGSLGTVWMEPPTTSGPGWASLLTGAGHAEHGVRDNDFGGHRLQYHPDLLSRVWFADPYAETFAAVAWPALADPGGPGPVIHSRVDQQRRGQHRVVIRSAIPYGAAAADRELAAIAPRLIDGLGRGRSMRAGFVYFEGVDEAAHVYGGDSPEYRTAMSIVDGYLRPIVQAIEDRRRADPGEDWLLAVTTDHGQTTAAGADAHGGDSETERRSFLAVRYFGEPGSAAPEAMAATELAGFLLAQVLAPRDGPDTPDSAAAAAAAAAPPVPDSGARS